MQCSLARRIAPTHPTRPRDKEVGMDGSQFDAWTRRGFGAAAGGLAGALLAQAAIPGAEAKKKKKRCKKLNDACNSGKKKCCCGYECQPQGMSAQRFCCRAPGFPDQGSPQNCCSGRSELGKCICKTLGQGCGAGRECCSGFCVSGTCDDSPPPPP
jgi:hypothetical protein